MSMICYVSIIIWLCAIWLKVYNVESNIEKMNNVKSDIKEIKTQCKHLSEKQELLCNHVVKNTDILTELIDDIIDDIMEIEQNNEHNNQI